MKLGRLATWAISAVAIWVAVITAVAVVLGISLLLGL